MSVSPPSPSPEPPEIGKRIRTLPGFLCEFLAQDRQRPDRPFCFILGAGASKESNIPTGQQMAAKWLEEIHHRENTEELPLQDWATEERLEIEGFDPTKPALHYSKLYERRYFGDEDGGYAFLESVMEKSEPSFGYSVLAYLLGETSHKIVITTNFDNLVADALAVHADNFPVVVTDDALVRYVRSKVRRPLIAKVHGSLGFTPKSKAHDLRLSEDWRKALTEVFRSYTPVVIGYDGNDGSLMSLLESLDEGVPDRIWWCYYSPSGYHRASAEELPERIRRLIAAHNGFLVPIAGFDSLMAELLKHIRGDLKIPDLHDRLRKKSEGRLDAYDVQWQRLCGNEDTVDSDADSKPPKLAAALTSPPDEKELQGVMRELAKARAEKTWWQWQAEINEEISEDGKNTLYLKAISALPESAELLGNRANFLKTVRKDYDAAEEFYKRSIDADPGRANVLGNYANFLTDIRKNYDAAEEFYKRSINADPRRANVLGNYANFLTDIREDHDSAEEFYKRSIDADPGRANVLGNYANFLTEVRNDYDAAEELYKRSIDADPVNANVLGNYANFLTEIRGDHDPAQEFYKRAIDANPGRANNLSNYANFLADVRRDYDTAEKFFKRSIDADPANAYILGNYANFLTDVRARHDSAEEFYKRAIDADPGRANNLSNYANFLTDVRRDHDAAEEFYKRSIDADPMNSDVLGNYAHFLTDALGDHDAAEEFYKRSIGVDPVNKHALGNYANFLTDIRADHSEAEEFYKRSIGAYPTDANVLGNYANFLTDVRGDYDSAEEFYKRAIDADPANANVLGNYANFLGSIRGDHNSAEEFYKRSIDADPLNANVLGNHAAFLSELRGDHSAAEKFYKLSIDADPLAAAVLGNYGQMLLGLDRLVEGLSYLHRAWELADKKDSYLRSEFAYSLWLGALFAGDKQPVWERILKRLLSAKFHRSQWSFDKMLSVAEKRLEPGLFEWAKALAAAVLDADKAAALEGFPRWQELEPLDPDLIDAEGKIRST